VANLPIKRYAAFGKITKDLWTKAEEHDKLNNSSDPR
jgi:hypothetical protein